MRKNVVNGVNVDKLTETINVVKQNPELAKFAFRAKNRWISGGQSVTEIQDFYGTGKEDTSRTEPFEIMGDEPPVLLGDNIGPNAVEVILHAIASCMAVGFAYSAAARGIIIEELEFELEGDMDLQGFLGLSDKVRPGYQEIRINCRIVANAPKEKLEELCEYVQKTSPVLDIIRNSVPISINLK